MGGLQKARQTSGLDCSGRLPSGHGHSLFRDRQAGVAAVTEQTMAVEPDTPGTVHAIHRADVRIIVRLLPPMLKANQTRSARQKSRGAKNMAGARGAQCSPRVRDPFCRRKHMVVLLPWLTPSPHTSSPATRQ